LTPPENGSTAPTRIGSAAWAEDTLIDAQQANAAMNMALIDIPFTCCFHR
jgi:hypothetical protein